MQLLESELTPGQAWFDEEAHVYYPGDLTIRDEGDPLVSGSGFAKRYQPEFRREAILNAVSKKHGIPVEVIEKQWEAKRDASLDLGNACHRAIEAFGVGLNTGGPEVVCKQPYLKAVVEAFFTEERRKQEALYEQFVISEEHNACGTLDRIILKPDRHCDLEDHKTNADLHKSNGWMLEPFKHMKNNPLSGYILQANWYRSCLEQAGWVVDEMRINWLRANLTTGLPWWDTVILPRVEVFDIGN